MSDWDARKEVLRKRLNTPFPQRVDAVNALAERYRFPDVALQALDVLKLRPTPSVRGYAGGPYDVSYEVSSGGLTRGIWIWREPYYASHGVQVLSGMFYDLPSELYQSYDTKRVRLFSLELNEDGILGFKPPYGFATQLGTTATLKGHRELLAAVKAHIHRKP